ncbi:hypothetical protein ACQ4PT_041284 [Festuca glaucescens]
MALAAAVLPLDGDGSPRTLRLFAALFKAKSRRFATAASQPAENDLVLAGAYLARFMGSSAARDAGILVEPATAHRLISVAVLLGAKFSSPRHFKRRVEARVESFQICSDQCIRASEMYLLELLFLRAVDCHIFIGDQVFQRFSRILEGGPTAPSASCGSKKRKAEAAADREEEEEPRRVRACQPPVVVS